MIVNQPYNLDAERALVGAILSRPDALDMISLEPSAFYLQTHQQVVTAARQVRSNGQAPNLLTVADTLRQQKLLEAIGGIGALTDLVETSWVPNYDIPGLVQAVRKCAIRRQLIDTGGKIAVLGFEEQGDLDSQLADAHNMLQRVSSGATDATGVLLKDALDTWYAEATGEDDDRLYVSTGLRDLDQVLGGGLWRGDLTVLAARPSVGKSALGMCVADAVAAAYRPVIWFSLEMPIHQLIGRLVAMHTKIDAQRIRTHRIREDELPIIADAMEALNRRKFVIDDTAARTLTQIRAVCQKRRQEYGDLGLVVVDYLGLVQATERYAGQRVNEVSEISRGLKNLARDLDTPILALHQLSRAIEGRTVKVPMLSDLRDSGAVEQDADNVLFIHREEIYDKDTDKKGVAEVHIAKQRNGPLGIVPLRYDAATTKFSTLSYRDMDGY